MAVIAGVQPAQAGGVFINSTAFLGDSIPFIWPIAPAGRALDLLPRLDVTISTDLVAACA